MAYRNGNYSAFYVSESGNESNLRAHSVRDFVYYSMLRAWEGSDSSFPFIDSHNKNYSVRDGSDWELTLKPRIRERLSKSKNIVLFLSSITVNSQALREEIKYGVDSMGLPIIVVYPEYKEKSDIINCSSNNFRKQITDLWDRLPAFRDRMDDVPTLHVPNKKVLIKKALNDSAFQVGSKGPVNTFFYPC